MKKIIVAPMNWGLGHASRCIPIIKALSKYNFTPVIASDGIALKLLQKEFPNTESITLPSYKISYGKNLKWNLFLSFPTIYKAVKKEQKIIEEYVIKNKNVIGIISDNRFGVKSKLVPSVYITHQITVFSGITTFFTSLIHQKIIKSFDECWIPDTKDSEFSGKLSSVNNSINKKFIGVLSRFSKIDLPTDIDILILLSGIEPNRTLLEKKLLLIFKNQNFKTVLVQGKIEKHQKRTKQGNIKIINFTLSEELEKLLNSSQLIVCRSGYSSIMDLANLQKKAFFIPTKNQSEQEYLASFLANKKMTPFSSIENFSIDLLNNIKDYDGLSCEKTNINKELFSLFKGKRKI